MKHIIAILSMLLTLLCANTFAQSRVDELESLTWASSQDLEAEINIFQMDSARDDFGLAVYEKALKQAKAGRLHKALNTIKRLEKLNSEQIKPVDVYHLAFIYHLSGDYDVAGRYLSQLDYYHQRGQVDFQYEPLLCINAVMDEDWVRARETLTSHLKAHHSLPNRKADSIVGALIPPKTEKRMRSPDVARRFGIVPGLGQLYSGKVFPALVSLTLISGSIVYGVYSWNTGYFLNSTLTGGTAALVFWLGGSRNAEHLALLRNQKRKEKIVEKLNRLFVDL